MASPRDRTAVSKEKWKPTEGTFLLASPEPLKTLTLNEAEWLGIYQGPTPGGELLYASRSPLALYRKLKRKRKHAVPAICWPVSARRAASNEELSKPLITEPQDDFQKLRRCAYEAIAEARKRVRNDIGLYSEAEVKTAQDFLRDLGKEARNSGKPKGDRPQAHENAKMLQAFYLASKGKSLKEIAIEMNGSKNYESKMRSLSVQMKRFSQRVARTYCSRHRCNKVPESIFQNGAHEKCWGTLSSVFGSIERWPGVRSNCLEHGYALCEALRRYKPDKDGPKPSITYKFQQL